jgi:hypothetical protein
VADSAPWPTIIRRNPELSVIQTGREAARGSHPESTPNGSEYIVWTQDYGHLLGYATGAASHEQVWNWFYTVHHNITFPGQSMTGMPG